MAPEQGCSRGGEQTYPYYSQFTHFFRGGSGSRHNSSGRKIGRLLGADQAQNQFPDSRRNLYRLLSGLSNPVSDFSVHAAAPHSVGNPAGGRRDTRFEPIRGGP